MAEPGFRLLAGITVKYRASACQSGGGQANRLIPRGISWRAGAACCQSTGEAAGGCVMTSAKWQWRGRNGSRGV
ncbi:hypothetical protein PUN4_840126 [Paraburkholderia unamae]|nr:hypothetical protein PUN4_840126 [Paraburkholderia unamae]